MIVSGMMNQYSPSDVMVGKVLSVSPLRIMIEQKEILDSPFFKLTRAVLDHYVDIEVNHVTEKRAGGSGDPAFESHDHDYKGRKKIMIYNGLKVGEEVLMIKVTGGQSFVIIDRVDKHIVNGEWGGG